MRLKPDERRQLAAILGVTPSEVLAQLKRFEDAASEEYVRMILGQRVFTRGQDMREYRLFLIIRHVYGGELPDERTISALFQTTRTESRALLRAVMSKYQYEMQDGIDQTLRNRIQLAEEQPGADTVWAITVDSVNEIDALNRKLAAADGTLPQISKVRGSVSTYAIPEVSYEKLKQLFDL